MEYLLLENVDKIVGSEVHLKNINLRLKAGSRTILLGRTLAGKTSLLRMLAGLDRPTSGKIIIDGQDVTGVSVRKRSVAMVYQQFINYPSMTVYDNIASPLKLSKMKHSEIEHRVHETAKMLHIDNLLDRLPAELSGGQQQRTAIARALVKDSQLLLLDEPLVNLDYKLREELRDELQEIFKQRDSIVVYTTTEPAEALMLGGDAVVLDEGRVLQEGSTSDVFRTPASVKVSQVFSDPLVNIIDGRIQGNQMFIGETAMPMKGHLKNLDNGDYLFGIRPNDIHVTRQKNDDVELAATINLVELSGSESFVHAVFMDKPVLIQADGLLKYKIGEMVRIYLNPEKVLAFDQSGRLVAAP